MGIFGDFDGAQWCWKSRSFHVQLLKLKIDTQNSHLGGGFKHFYFHPYLERWSNLTNIFQVGWNHQLEIHVPRPISFWNPFIKFLGVYDSWILLFFCWWFLIWRFYHGMNISNMKSRPFFAGTDVVFMCFFQSSSHFGWLHQKSSTTKPLVEWNHDNMSSLKCATPEKVRENEKFTPWRTNMTGWKIRISIGNTSSNGGCFIVMLVFRG